MQFGPKPFSSDVSVKLGGGQITFMKILVGKLEPSAVAVAMDSN